MTFHTGVQNYTCSWLLRQGSTLHEIQGQHENRIQASDFHVLTSQVKHLLIKNSSFREIFGTYALYNVMCRHPLWRKPNPRHCPACKDFIYQIDGGWGGEVHMWEEAKEGCRLQGRVRAQCAGKIQTERGPAVGLHHVGGRLVRVLTSSTAGVVLLWSSTAQRLSTAMKVRETEALRRTRQRPF